MKENVIKIVLRIVWIICLIVSIIAYGYVNTLEFCVGKAEDNYIIMAIFALIDLVFGYFIFSKKDKRNKILISLYLIFLLATFFIPTYSIGAIRKDGPDNPLAGAPIEERYYNVYGIKMYVK